MDTDNKSADGASFRAGHISGDGKEMGTDNLNKWQNGKGGR